MEPEFITFSTFDDIALATNLGEQLDKHHIEYIIEEEAALFNGSSVFNRGTRQKIVVKIKPHDFEKANNLLAEDEAVDVDAIEKDYYLFDFTDEELVDLIHKADEWSAFDNVLARKILAERGKPISDEAISAIKAKRIEELKVVDKPQTFWIVFGYIVAFLGGVLGVFIGWHLWTFKKTLPDGERVYDYSESDRRHGKRIFYISVVVFAIAFILKFTL